jgi:uncharacterized RDD family membrane protein YckC
MSAENPEVPNSMKPTSTSFLLLLLAIGLALGVASGQEESNPLQPPAAAGGGSRSELDPVSPDPAASGLESPGPAAEGPTAEAAEVAAPELAPIVPGRVERIPRPEEEDTARAWVRRGDVVAIGQHVKIAANERAGDVVVVLGSLEIEGRADGDVVVVGGTAKINAPVGGDLVVVGGGAQLGAGASVRGDVVVVGGRFANEHQVKIGGKVVAIHQRFPAIEPLLDWVHQCLLLGRPMAPTLGWTWVVAGAFLAFYLFLALVFGRGVNATVRTLEERPGGTLLTAILALPLFPLFLLLLAITGVGVLLVPFVLMGLVCGVLFGKAAFLAFLGRSVMRPFGGEPGGPPALAALVGGTVLILLYLVPYLGLLLWALTAWIGTGMVLFTILLGMRRENVAAVAAAPGAAPAAPAPSGNPFVQPVAPRASTVAAPMDGPAAPPAAVEPGRSAVAPPAVPAVSDVEGVPPPPAAGSPPPPLIGARVAPAMHAPLRAPVAPPVSAATLERAGFGIRLGALAIDVVLIGVIAGMLGGSGSVFPLLFGAYCAGLWFWRSTTIGGIVCGLKIVRIDDRPVDFATALVRTLGAYLSVLVAGLGFLWVAWDPERQTWHDKIAGTTVVRVPKGISLV